MILLIEDDATTRDVTAMVLRSAGHEVLTAANGQEALALLETVLPAVIFSDLDMPDLDGWAFRRLQLASPDLRHIPFVILSALPTADDDGRALSAAVVLRKPVDASDLLECARRFDVQ